MGERKMRNTMHATLSHGGYRYVYEDGAGLRCTIEALKRRGPERRWWTHDALPGQQFQTPEAVDTKLAETMPDDLIREAEKYPRLSAVKLDTCGNACRLCPRPNLIGDDKPGSRVKHETWRFTIDTSWQDCHCALLCAEHRDEYDGKPRQLLAALEAEVAARRKRWADSELARTAAAAIGSAIESGEG